MKVDIKKLEKLLKLKTHKGIVNNVSRVSKDKYVEYKDSVFSIFVPMDMADDEILPCIVSHTDTVSEKKPTRFEHKNGVISNPDGVLGADDRAGVYIIYEMMKRGTRAIYVLTDLEEVGGIGASACGEDIYFGELAENNISCLIELDRENKDHCATYGYDNEKLINLMKELGGYKEDWGSYTDVATLSQHTDIACVNLSVGYYGQHTKKEYLVIEELRATLNFMIDLPKEFYGERFEVEYMAKSRFTSSSSWRYGSGYVEEYEEICCEICASHTALFRYEKMMVCDECIEWYEYGIGEGA